MRVVWLAMFFHFIYELKVLLISCVIACVVYNVLVTDRNLVDVDIILCYVE